MTYYTCVTCTVMQQNMSQNCRVYSDLLHLCYLYSDATEHVTVYSDCYYTYLYSDATKHGTERAVVLCSALPTYACVVCCLFVDSVCCRHSQVS